MDSSKQRFLSSLFASPYKLTVLGSSSSSVSNNNKPWPPSIIFPLKICLLDRLNHMSHYPSYVTTSKRLKLPPLLKIRFHGNAICNCNDYFSVVCPKFSSLQLFKLQIANHPISKFFSTLRQLLNNYSFLLPTQKPQFLAAPHCIT